MMDKEEKNKRYDLKAGFFQVTMTALLMVILFMAPTGARAETIPTNVPPEDVSPGSTGALDFYQAFLSRADGDRCPMFPSCSEYAKQAFRQHGFIKGWVLTCDRLLRCGRDEIRLAPVIKVHGAAHTYDPLSANTFWWKQK